MDEYLDILTKDGQPTGKTALKSEAHKKGLFHATVHIWFYTATGDVLFQKRSATKETFPNYWDVSVAGHVLAGETIEDAALREVKEEIGIAILKTELVKIDVRKNINYHPNGIIDCEFQNVFLCKLDIDLHALNKQDEEVDALCLRSLEEFKYFTANRNEAFKLVPADYSYYTFVIDSITNVL
ncbi:Putative Nudix hydrolase YfcD [hydrothermal vent metagenome]|uniref:Nudix hydrolase YfcD n=1 Tax=hydrothermal vent metagenome TaxID=652676 RepID=A0A3B0QKV2_9ZZZZ